jgi:hypothetical protein
MTQQICTVSPIGARCIVASYIGAVITFFNCPFISLPPFSQLFLSPNLYISLPISISLAISISLPVRSLSVSFFIEKEPHKQLRMKRKRKGER